jgi:hypothetical protein
LLPRRSGTHDFHVWFGVKSCRQPFPDCRMIVDNENSDALCHIRFFKSDREP